MGKSEEQVKKEERLSKEFNFKRGEAERLKEIKEEIERGNFREEWKRNWWYCNSIEGYPAPSKENALERLKMFIESYKEGIEEIREVVN